MATLELDPATQKIVDDFDAQAKKRVAELLPRSPHNEPLERIRDNAFCIGYKAGVIDLSNVQRLQTTVDFSQLVAVFEAACDWRDDPLMTSALEAQLIAAVDAARASKKEGGS